MTLERFDDDEPENDAPPTAEAERRIVARGRSSLLPLGICFLVLGILSALYGLYQIQQAVDFETNWQRQVQLQKSANQNMPAAQQQVMNDMLDTMKGFTKATTIMVAILSNTIAYILIAGGICFLRVTARPFCYVTAIAAMLPLTHCCLGSLPLGIWAIVVLGRPDTREAFRLLKRRGRKSLTLQGDEFTFTERDALYAEHRTRSPGLWLMVFGCVGLIVSSVWLGVMISHPDLMVQGMKELEVFQFSQAQKDVFAQQIEDQKDQLMLNRPLPMASSALGFLGNILMIAGGLALRRRKSYALAMAGAIAAISMLQGCSIFALPFGVWALIVLADLRVRHAFRSADVSSAKA